MDPQEGALNMKFTITKQPRSFRRPTGTVKPKEHVERQSHMYQQIYKQIRYVNKFGTCTKTSIRVDLTS